MPKGPKRRGSTTQRQFLTAEHAIFHQQLGLGTRAQVLQGGISPQQIRVALARGRWERVAPGLYALANWPELPNRRLLALCLATGGVASHTSAAWIWGLLEREPRTLMVTVPHGRHPRLTHRATAEAGNLLPALSHVVIHQSRDISDEPTSTWHGVPTTTPVRALVDSAGMADAKTLDDAIDVALSRRLVTIEGLVAGASQLRQHGRRGPAQLITALRRRGFVGAPAPSVLESRVLRLLHSAHIAVERCEATPADGNHYRLDIQLAPRLFLEVDGFAYHWSPGQKQYDEARRNRLRSLGNEILVYDWTTVTKQGQQLVNEVKFALHRHKRRGA